MNEEKEKPSNAQKQKYITVHFVRNVIQKWKTEKKNKSINC